METCSHKSVACHLLHPGLLSCQSRESLSSEEIVKGDITEGSRGDEGIPLTRSRASGPDFNIYSRSSDSFLQFSQDMDELISAEETKFDEFNQLCEAQNESKEIFRQKMHAFKQQRRKREPSSRYKVEH